MGQTKVTVDVITADEPVSLADARVQCRLDLIGGSSHPMDGLLQTYIRAARRYAEHYCDRAFAKRTLVYAMDEFPFGEDSFTVEVGPMKVDTVVLRYRDANDVEQTLAATEYFVDDTGRQNRIYLAPNKSWPTTGTRRLGVRVTYETEPAAVACPDIARDAMLLLVRHLHDNPSASISGTIIGPVPFGVNALLDAERNWGGV